MSDPKIPILFHVYEGDQLVRTERLAQEIIKVGKLSSSHLRIDDEHVSRMHAVVEVTGPDEIFIIDLGSATGTIVNGKKVNKCKLKNGDEIKLGNTRVTVEVLPSELDGADTVVRAPQAPEGEGELSLSDAAIEEAAPAAPKPLPTPPRVSSTPPPVPDPFAAPDPVVAAASPMANPFAAPVGAAAGAQDAPGANENVEYGIAASGPPVSADEVESAERAVEVIVMWGDKSVLHVEHLSPARAFYVGEPSGKLEVDYLMGSEVLGTDRMPVCVESGAGVAVVVPEGATGEVTAANGQMRTVDQLRAEGQLAPCPELPGAMQFPLAEGATARVAYRGFTFAVKPVNAGKRIAAGFAPDWRPIMYIGGSLLFSVILLLTFYFLPPSPASLSLDLLNADSRLVQYLMEPPATEEEEEPEWLQNADDDNEGGQGKRHKDEEGQMGKEESKKTTNKYGIEGPEDNEDPHMAREEAREQARNAGILGTLRAMSGSWNSPTSPYGQDTALGNDPMSALGALMGDQIGENFGFGGLGLRGTGRGGGGTGEGTIGLGNFGTIGHGGGTGDGSGYGRGAGGFRGRSARVPKIRSGSADVRGSLSKEVIRRVVRRHLNEVRFCYEQELNQRPDLEGRVTVRFIITPTGSVQTSMVAGTTIRNQRVESCIAQSVRRWTFPAPDGGGVVIVNYPFMLQAAGG